MEVRCADLGLHCRHRLRADSLEEFVRSLRQHADEAHGVPHLNETLVDYAVSRAGSAEARRDE